MSKKIQKYLKECLLKIKKPNQQVYLLSKNWIRSSCKHPKTMSFAFGRAKNDTNNNNNDNSGNADISAKLSDIDQFLAENFRSLYTDDEDEPPRFDDPVPNLRGSNRFFVSPGISSSLVEESESRSSISTTTATTNEEDCTISVADDGVTLPSQCVAVLSYSPNPRADFRRSMNEVVEARLRREKSLDWGFMEEVLFSYLDLNDKKSHGFVLSAFVDLVVDLRDGGDELRPSHGGERKRNKVSLS